MREAILSGWITTGPRTKKLEQQISEYVHTDKTVCLNSATAALEMVLHLLDIQPDDEVIVPAYTYTATGTGGRVPVSRIIGVSVLYMLRGSRIKGTGTFIHPFKFLKRA